ncbi:GGDEF domain-containing protein [Thalassomonas actiniarum]|uniref:diguanylate cyclase n=1 Tax=Thalassomonas actiniarum TaxID=485447 RepID=A0AAE9YNU2_9GAMM|nr:diguanylate cyclase [Thalassomonas actiniarum]WDD96857.1 diguanylate cyclase [Thalassomonas actiniarum]
MNILVVDDNKCIRDVIGAMVLASDHQPVLVDGHVAALEKLRRQVIDVILMDIEMPEVDGLTLTRMVRKEFSQWIPIIFLSANDSARCLAEGIKAGGDDYLTKPVKEEILNAKILAMARIAKMKQQLDEANKKLEMLSCIDPLTNVLNRRGLEQELDAVWQKNIRQRGELSLLMLDIDFFKAYNDNYGHPRGDQCLQRVASVLAATLLKGAELLARYGGEEFVMLLPSTSLSQAKNRGRNIIAALNQAEIVHEYSDVAPRVTVSIGISNSTLGAKDPLALIEQADQALYQAKRLGRMQCVLFQKMTTAWCLDK